MFSEQIELAAEWIANSKNLVVFTGAGISTESGLPDFRGPDGVWTRRDKGLPPPKTKKPWHLVDPNPAHYALVELQDLGILKFLISQNVDNLHIKSGIRLENIAELHGNTTLMVCLNCNKKLTHEEAGWDQRIWGPGYRTSPIRAGQPKCPFCGGRIISSIVNFGDPLPEADLTAALKFSNECDVFLVIGSSLVVTPAAYCPQIALRARAKLIIINEGETPFDDAAHIRLFGKAGPIMTQIVKRVKELLRQKQ
ncbi:MAG: SIR2 family NAD-dependent protein deacylase [Candidatus Helarchaeota archaeon]